MRDRIKVPLFLFATLFFTAACSERRQARLIEEADSKISQGLYSEASEMLKRAVALNPESRTAVKALYKRGFVLETYLRDFENALFNYNEFMRLATDPVATYEVRKRVANLYFEQTNDPEHAAEAYQKLLSLNPESLEGDVFQFRLGQSYFRMNEFQKAREQYQMLLDRYPKSQFTARTRYEIGNAYYMEGTYEIAVEALKQVVRNHPQSDYAVEAQFLASQCLEHLDKPQLALQSYEGLLDKYTPREVLELRIREVTKKLKRVKP